MEHNGEAEKPQQKPADEETTKGQREFTRTELPLAGPDEMRRSAHSQSESPDLAAEIDNDLNIHKIPSGTQPGIEPGELEGQLLESERKGKPQIGNKMHREDDPDRYS